MAGITINARLRKRRIAAGLTQQAVADKIGATQPTIGRWERDKLPTDDELSRLEAVLGPIRNRRRHSPKGEPHVGEDADDDGRSSTADNVFNVSISKWLKGEREKQNMTVAELARKAEISYQTVVSIENERILNPQQKTIKRLEAALSQKVPDEIKAEVQSESQVSSDTDVGGLTDFDPHDDANWPKSAGIYVLYDISERPIYVGKAQVISTRLKSHEQKFWFKSPIIHYASYVEVRDAQLRSKIERVMIKFLKSNAVINKHSTETFEDDT